jgi:hypothetical protein
MISAYLKQKRVRWGKGLHRGVKYSILLVLCTISDPKRYPKETRNTPIKIGHCNIQTLNFFQLVYSEFKVRRHRRTEF